MRGRGREGGRERERVREREKEGERDERKREAASLSLSFYPPSFSPSPPSLSSLSLSRYLKSTSGNIQLIKSLRGRHTPTSNSTDKSSEEKMFGFWMEFFLEAQQDSVTDGLIPVCFICNYVCIVREGGRKEGRREGERERERERVYVLILSIFFP